MRLKRVVTWPIIAVAVFLTACSTATVLVDPGPAANLPSAADINAAAEQAAAEDVDTAPTETTVPDPFPTTEPTEQAEPAPTESPQTNPRVEVPDGLFVNWLIPPDGIRPIYEPEFASAAESPLNDSELIIGIAWDDKNKKKK